MSMRLPERRRDERIDVSRPAKVQCGITGRYIPARVRNLSTGGALIELRTRTPLVSGQSLRVGIAHNDRQPLLSATDLAEAQVIRSLSHDDTHHVAIEFAHRLQLVAA
jgi:c-di-GMP-binding flagellar brake protein YcgR